MEAVSSSLESCSSNTMLTGMLLVFPCVLASFVSFPLVDQIRDLCKNCVKMALVFSSCVRKVVQMILQKSVSSLTNCLYLSFSIGF